MSDQEKKAADQITGLLQQVKTILGTLPADSTLQQMGPIMDDLIKNLKGSGGNIGMVC